MPSGAIKRSCGRWFTCCCASSSQGPCICLPRPCLGSLYRSPRDHDGYVSQWLEACARDPNTHASIDPGGSGTRSGMRPCGVSCACHCASAWGGFSPQRLAMHNTSCNWSASPRTCCEACVPIPCILSVSAARGRPQAPPAWKTLLAISILCWSAGFASGLQPSHLQVCQYHVWTLNATIHPSFSRANVMTLPANTLLCFPLLQ